MPLSKQAKNFVKRFGYFCKKICPRTLQKCPNLLTLVPGSTPSRKSTKIGGKGSPILGAISSPQERTWSWLEGRHPSSAFVTPQKKREKTFYYKRTFLKNTFFKKRPKKTFLDNQNVKWKKRRSRKCPVRKFKFFKSRIRGKVIFNISGSRWW